MLDRADAILKLALALAALFLGGGVGYYYGVFLPEQGAKTQEERVEAAKAELSLKRRLDEQRTANATAAKVTYDVCLASSQQDYASRWESSCGTQNQADLKARRGCVAQGYDEQYCASYIVRPASDCTLPGGTAATYDGALQKAKELCIEEYKASHD